VHGKVENDLRSLANNQKAILPRAASQKKSLDMTNANARWKSVKHFFLKGHKA
jgi:hypothetical protein